MHQPLLPYSYKNSVKSDISDELVNVYLQRPLAGIVTRAVYFTPITPTSSPSLQRSLELQVEFFSVRLADISQLLHSVFI